MPSPAPRIYAIPALRAPVAAVLSHHPGRWWMLSRWDLAGDALTLGAWIHGQLYPRRCDLSPDGKLLYYFAIKTGVRGWMGENGFLEFSAVSKLPWFFALAAWRESCTYGNGFHFAESENATTRPWDIGPPDHGDAGPLRARWGMARTETGPFASERRRGWVEHESCPPRLPDDGWDQRRRVVLVKKRPHGDEHLVLTDRGYAPGTPGATEGRCPAYRIEVGRGRMDLTDVVWADWDARGRLIVATVGGALQVRDPAGLEVVWERDLAGCEVSRGPAPLEAQRW